MHVRSYMGQLLIGINPLHSEQEPSGGRASETRSHNQLSTAALMPGQPQVITLDLETMDSHLVINDYPTNSQWHYPKVSSRMERIISARLSHEFSLAA